MNSLELVLVYLLAAVMGVVGCRMLKLPPILGYLVIGVLIGPHALSLVNNTEGVRYLAEFGVVFLMFLIGLEFSLPQLKRMGRHVFGLGLTQVLVTMLLATAGSLALGWAIPQWWRMNWQTALALGSVMAMSSTAIVIKIMVDRLEIDTEHGKRVLGVLLFQDLAVVPLLILIPALSSPGHELFGSMGWALLKGGLLLLLLFVGGRHLLRWWLSTVARRKSEELFMLNLLLITLGLAWLTEHMGLSLALGAFVAGMLISETPYKHQVEIDIRPFHDVLLGLFFITIGMMLDWRILIERWPLVLLLTTLPLLFKAVVITSLTRVWGAPLGTSLRTGLFLTQAGEFGLVLLMLAFDRGLIPPELLNPILASMILSMIATPFVIEHNEWFVSRLAGNDWLMQSVQMTAIARKTLGTQNHVVICGYGRSGQNLARMLQAENIPFVAMDTDPDIVQQSAAAGYPVVFGDATKLQALSAAGVARASAVVITHPSVPSALKVLAGIRQLAPHVPIMVRTIGEKDMDRLIEAGATAVVPEAIEGSLMLASHALAMVGVPMRRVIRRVQEQREARYGLLRGYFHSREEDEPDDADAERLQTLILQDTADAVGRLLADFAIYSNVFRIVAIRRDGRQISKLDANTQLQSADVLVISTTPEGMAQASQLLLKGRIT